MRKILSTIFVLSILATILTAQSRTGTIQGIVQDAAKALIPGVRLTLTNEETKMTYQVLSGESGEYKFEVPAGTYSLTVELPGFKSAQVSDVRVKEDESNPIDPVTLEVNPGRPPGRFRPPFRGNGGRIPLAPVVKEPPIPL